MMSDKQVLDYLAHFDGAVHASSRAGTPCQVHQQTIEKIARFLNTTDYGARLTETHGHWAWKSQWLDPLTSPPFDVLIEGSVPIDTAKVGDKLFHLDRRTQARVFLTSFDSIVSGHDKCKVNASAAQALIQYSKLLDAGYDPYVPKEQLLLGLIGTWAGMSCPNTDGVRVQIWIDLRVPHNMVSVEEILYPLSGYTPLMECATDLVLEF